MNIYIVSSNKATALTTMKEGILNAVVYANSKTEAIELIREIYLINIYNEIMCYKITKKSHIAFTFFRPN